jgi:dienelactone hydrolase
MPPSKNYALQHERIPVMEAAEYDPFPRGRFAVGVRRFELRDSARHRLFPSEVWYPAALHYAGQDLAPETQDCFTAGSKLSNTPRRQMAVRDAIAQPGAYPLIIFSHHSGGHRRAATFLCTHLSSHGYVVAALDHSEVVAQELARPKSETEEQKKARWQAVIASRVPDVRFLLDQLLNDAVWKSEARLDPARIGIVGHSFGAWTALAAPEVEPRIRVAVALAPGGASNPRPGILPVNLSFAWTREVPALYLVAENDVPLPLAGMRELFERAPAPKQMVILRRADHLHFIDNVEQEHEAFRTMPPMAPELAQMQAEMRPITELSSGEQAHLWVRGLALAHMDAILNERREAQQLLAGDIEGELAKRGVEVKQHLAISQEI